MLDKTIEASLDLRIRAASPDDLNVVRTAAHAAQQQALASVPASAWWRGINRGELAVHVAVVEGNKIVGVIATTKLPLLNTIEVLLLFVAPAYRRRRIATRLLENVAGKADGVRFIVPHGNTEMLGMLRRVGFSSADGLELMVRV